MIRDATNSEKHEAGRAVWCYHAKASASSADALQWWAQHPIRVGGIGSTREVLVRLDVGSQNFNIWDVLQNCEASNSISKLLRCTKQVRKLVICWRFFNGASSLSGSAYIVLGFDSVEFAKFLLVHTWFARGFDCPFSLLWWSLRMLRTSSGHMECGSHVDIRRQWRRLTRARTTVSLQMEMLRVVVHFDTYRMDHRAWWLLCSYHVMPLIPSSKVFKVAGSLCIECFWNSITRSPRQHHFWSPQLLFNFSRK